MNERKDLTPVLINNVTWHIQLAISLNDKSNAVE